jgi:ribosomal-protein-alanine N-acetyltransferase
MLEWQNKYNGQQRGDLAYIIRPMEKGDLGQVNEIDREAFPSQWPPPNYRQELQNRLAHYLVAIDDTRTAPADAGSSKKPSKLMAWLAPWRKNPQNEPPSPRTRQYIIGFSGIWLMADEAHITNIAVAQEYRGRGMGELLLIGTIDLARGLKASTMTLEARASNIAAQGLYGKYGFVRTGVRRGYYLDNKEDAVIMSTENVNSATFQERLQQLRESLGKKLA